MSEPIGRKSIRKTLEKLKTHSTTKATFFLEHQSKPFENILSRRLKDTKDLAFFLTTLDIHNSAVDLIRLLMVYIEALESYLSELDETFDKLLEGARKEAEKQLKEMPKERPDIYG